MLLYLLCECSRHSVLVLSYLAHAVLKNQSNILHNPFEFHRQNVKRHHPEFFEETYYPRHDTLM